MSYRVEAAQPAPGPRRKGLIVLGVIVLLGGVGAGAAVYATSQSTYSDAVGNLARVPAGCATEVRAEKSSSFVIYVETQGTIGDLRGSCENVDADYERDDAPDVDITVLDRRDDEVDVDDYDGTSYDVDGYVGTAVGRVDLEEGETYTVEVASDDDDFAVAIGHDPKGDADSAATIAIVIAAAAFLLGVVLIILGMRRKAAPPPMAPLADPLAVPQPGAAVFTPPSRSAMPDQPPGSFPAPPPPPAPRGPGHGTWTPPAPPPPTP